MRIPHASHKAGIEDKSSRMTGEICEWTQSNSEYPLEEPHPHQVKQLVSEQLPQLRDADLTLMMLRAIKSERELVSCFERIAGQEEETRT
jgi:hypothetical protein